MRLRSCRGFAKLKDEQCSLESVVEITRLNEESQDYCNLKILLTNRMYVSP